MQAHVPLVVVEELVAAGLAGAALVDALRRIVAGLGRVDVAASSGDGRPVPLTGAERMRRLRARRRAVRLAGLVVAASGDAERDATRDASVTPRHVEADIPATLPGGAAVAPVAGVERLADTRLIVARKALTVAGLGGNAVRVGAVLLETFNRNGSLFDHGLEKLAKMAGCSVRHFRRGVSELRARGLLAVVRHGGLGHANRYLPQFDAMRALVADWEAGTVTARQQEHYAPRHAPRHAEADKADGFVPHTQNKNIQTPRVRRARGAGKALGSDPRQGWLKLPLAGGLSAGLGTGVVTPGEAADGGAKRRLAWAFMGHSGRFGPRAAERMRAEIDTETWARGVAAERARAGSGLAVLLAALGPAGGEDQAAAPEAGGEARAWAEETERRHG